MNSPYIQQLISILSKLPGLGPRSGRRLALHLLKRNEQLMQPLIESLLQAQAHVQTCEHCHTLDTQSPCSICCDTRRDQTRLCVVADVVDIWAMERGHGFKGVYHVLGGLLSAIDGIGPEQLQIRSLVERARQNQFSEVILALSTTVEGQTTMHYVVDLIKHHVPTITTLAQGVPIGGELDYLDDGTLITAFNARRLVA
jgi:recombination protein RecR